MIPEGYRGIGHSTLVLKLKSAETGNREAVTRYLAMTACPTHQAAALATCLVDRSSRRPDRLRQFDLAILNN
jgi:hypothetical protein